MLERMVDGFNAHDIDAIMALFTSDCVFESPRGPDPCGTRSSLRRQERDVVETGVRRRRCGRTAAACRCPSPASSASSRWTPPKPPKSGAAWVRLSVSPVSSKKNVRKPLPGWKRPFSGRLNGVPLPAFAARVGVERRRAVRCRVVDRHEAGVEHLAVAVQVARVVGLDVGVSLSAGRRAGRRPVEGDRLARVGERIDLEHLQLAALGQVSRVVRLEPVHEAVGLLGEVVDRSGLASDVLDDPEVPSGIVLDSLVAADADDALQVDDLRGVVRVACQTPPAVGFSAVSAAAWPTDPTSIRRSPAALSCRRLRSSRGALRGARRQRRG